LEALYEQFKSLSTVEEGDGGIDKSTFEQCLGPLGLEKNLITERIFAFFDQDGDNIINFSELVTGLSVLCKGNLDEKIKCKCGVYLPYGEKSECLL
jgi:Ca2+-binding EF-hand superfamily protein